MAAAQRQLGTADACGGGGQCIRWWRGARAPVGAPPEPQRRRASCPPAQRARPCRRVGPPGGRCCRCAAPTRRGRRKGGVGQHHPVAQPPPPIHGQLSVGGGRYFFARRRRQPPSAPPGPPFDPVAPPHQRPTKGVWGGGGEVNWLAVPNWGRPPAQPHCSRRPFWHTPRPPSPWGKVGCCATPPVAAGWRRATACADPAARISCFPTVLRTAPTAAA